MSFSVFSMRLCKRSGTNVVGLNRLKELKEGPYTHKEADAAVGLWTDNGRGRAAETKEIDMM